MKQGYIPKEQRKKILLLCDDIRMHSGISTMAREIVLGTAHHYNWVNVGGALQHPEQGKKLDISEDTNKYAGITDASITIYPTSGYGSPELVRQLIKAENPDALMMFTDPRYWIWLFQMENEVRKHIPIIYLNIWDDLPAPHYNKPYYESCDALMAISKQTLNINRLVLKDKVKDKVLKYVPHGINENQFFPITPESPNYSDFLKYKKDILGDKEYDFVVFYNARNIRRKNPGDLILSFRTFLDKLPKEQAKKCALLLHTQPVDDNGTDLFAVRDLLCDPEYHNVVFTKGLVSTEQINMLYNMGDITMLISSNEGWGLSLTEAMMAGKMILGNTSGGMQDQMRFEDETGKWIDFTDKFPSNHFGTYKKAGEWALPVFPTNLSLVGSVPTPYIFDDRCDFRDVADQLFSAYNMSKEERIRRGLKAREWVTSKESMMSAAHMCDNVIDTIDTTFSTWKPRAAYELIKIEELKPNYINHPIIY